MTRFFFDTTDGELFLRDEEGLDCADATAARAMALKALSDLVRDVMLDGACRDIATDIRDATGRRIFTATLSMAARWVDYDLSEPTRRLSTALHE
ncbi:DUF6894 family protein [Muricoccus radiodurans]|uniref:DUF6894 family protein n=1 Tax=Muricoccus radiodurans TaxID=2231721 RepID=UPI003CF57812